MADWSQNYLAVTLWNSALTIEGGTFVGSNVVLNIQCQALYDSNGNLVDTNNQENPPLTDCITNLHIKDGTFKFAGSDGVCIRNSIGKTVIDGGTFSSTEELFQLDKGTLKAESRVIVNEGTFEAKESLIAYDTGYYNGAEIEIHGGEFKCKKLVLTYQNKGNGSTFGFDEITVDKAKIKIYGGTFSVDPTYYVVEGYKAEKNEEEETWTVKKN